MPADDPRLSEASEEQLRTRLTELEEGTTEYDRMMSLLLEVQRQAEKAEFEDVKMVQRELTSLSMRARAEVAIETRDCACGKKAGESCGESWRDVHQARIWGLDEDAIDKKARELRPDLFEKADRYARMVQEGRRGPRSSHV